jgi:hypothetical protein
MQGQSNEKDDEKGTSKILIKGRFLIIPQTLNSHYRDPRRLSNHQNLPSNQAEKDNVHDCSGERRVYTPLAEGHHAYVHDC